MRFPTKIYIINGNNINSLQHYNKNNITKQV